MLLLTIKTTVALAIIKDPMADRARGELRRRGHRSGSGIAVRALAVCLAASQATGGETGLTVPDVISIDAATNYWIALGFMVIRRWLHQSVMADSAATGLGSSFGSGLLDGRA